MNGPELRFCRKCGLTLREPTATMFPPLPSQAAKRLPWWRRWLPRRDAPDRSARLAYRRSLPISYRIRRWVIGVLVVLLVGGALALLGRNPIGWISDRWADLHNTLVEVKDVKALGEPAAAAVADHPAVDAVDGYFNTAWSTTFTQPDLHPGLAPGQCLPVDPLSTRPGTLLIELPGATRVRGIRVAAGLDENNAQRAFQWQPKTLQLNFSTGACQFISLAQDSHLQEVKISPVDTEQVRISIVDCWPAPKEPASNVASISTVRLLSRP